MDIYNQIKLQVQRNNNSYEVHVGLNKFLKIRKTNAIIRQISR